MEGAHETAVLGEEVIKLSSSFEGVNKQYFGKAEGHQCATLSTTGDDLPVSLQRSAWLVGIWSQITYVAMSFYSPIGCA
jgi:hypothetical protein